MSATFTLGGADLEGVGGPQSRSGTATFALGGALLTASSGGLSVAIYDEDNRWVTACPLAAGISYLSGVSEPGAVSCKLPLDDAATAEATGKRFLKVFWRGRCRQAARIDSSTLETAVDGRRWLSFDNLPGALNMLADIAVYPELWSEGSPWQSTTRTFGYMSEFSVRWWASGSWVKATTGPVQYQADTGFRAAKPAGLAYPNPWWIATNGAYHNEAPGQVQYHRHEFFSSIVDMPYQILCSADDIIVALWLDGEQIYSGSGQEAQSWRHTYQITGTLQPGKHIVAVKVINRRKSTSPMGFIFAIQQLQKNGDVVTGDPLLRSAPWWFTSDAAHVGWQAADVMTKLLFEGRNRSATSGQDFQAANLMRPSFDVDRGTDGVAWTDTPTEHEVDVPSSVLDAVTTFCEKYFDALVDPDTLHLGLYHRLGSDRHASVQLELGDGDSGSLLGNQIDRVESKGNTVLMQLADGSFVEDQNSASVVAVGRSEAGLSLGAVQSAAKAHAASGAFFDENAHAAETFTVTLYPLDGPQPYRDFDEGDSINVPDGSGGYVKVRVMAIGVTQPDDGGSVRISLDVAVDRS